MKVSLTSSLRRTMMRLMMGTRLCMRSPLRGLNQRKRISIRTKEGSTWMKDTEVEGE